MSRIDYDIIIASGGLGGSTLAKTLTEHGIRVLVVEREEKFKDRVRGEALLPWGVAEARTLGIENVLRKTTACEVRWWTRYLGSKLLDRRDFIATTPAQSGCLDFYHPEMQSVLLHAAEVAGADVQRGAAVIGITPGNPPAVRIRRDRRDGEFYARLVVGADGRNSTMRARGSFPIHCDPKRLIVAGVLYEGMQLPEDAVQVVQMPAVGQAVLVFPIGRQRFRTYLAYRRRETTRLLSGRQHLGEFQAACVETGAPQEWFEGAEVGGPLAAFDGADTWVDHPYRAGIVLIGDAAAASDPTWGHGLSMTLRDARVLRDQLLATTDWRAAADAYATEHDRYYASLHRLEDWLTILRYDIGPEADALRVRVLPRIAEDPSRAPDLLGLGPDAPSDEAARSRMFAEDSP